MRSRQKSKDTLKQMKIETTQNLWKTRKSILRKKCLALKAYFNKEQKAEINNLTLYFKELEKEQVKPK